MASETLGRAHSIVVRSIYMEHLAYIDEYSTLVAADREHTWAALVRVLRGQLKGGGPLARVLGASPSRCSGDWSGDLSGATMPGFAVSTTEPPLRLDLRGHHRFARYALIFELEASGDGMTRVRARTLADFPGLVGKLYRALVIGTRAHRVIVRRMLWRIQRIATARAR